MGYFCDELCLKKNWEGVLESIEGRLKRWMWPLPCVSFTGRTLVVNNLVSSSLWHRLVVVDPPPQSALMGPGYYSGLFLGWTPLASTGGAVSPQRRGRTEAGAPGQQACDVSAAVYSEAAVWTTGTGVETSGSADLAECQRSRITRVCVFNRI